MGQLVQKAFEAAVRYVRRLDIFKRLIVIFLLIILLPDVFIAGLAFSRFSKEMADSLSAFAYKSLGDLDKRIAERLRKYADMTYSIYLNEEIRGLLRTLNELGRNRVVIPAEKAEYERCKTDLGRALQRYAASYKDVINLEIVSGVGEYTLDDGTGEPTGARLADMTTFRASAHYRKALEYFTLPVWCNTARENDVYVPQANPSAHLGNYITLLRSIPGQGTEEPLGVIVVNVSLSVFANLVSDEDLPARGGNLVLLGDKDILYYFGPENRFPSFIRITPPVLEQTLRLNRENASMKIQGKEYLISAIKSEFSDWSLCAILPKDSLLEPVRQLRGMVAGVLIVSIAIAFALAYLVTFSIASPIRNLKQTMEAVGEQQLDITYQDPVEDEVGLLGRRFNSMLSRIRNLIDTVYQSELQKRAETIRRREAELDALQMQINPHFLYNTLDIIRWKVIAVETGGEAQASTMIRSFSTLLRLGTKKSDRMATLEEEIAHVEAYIEVVRFEWDHGLAVETHVEASLRQCRMPKLTLQPVVENAVVHGLRPAGRDGRITLRAVRQADALLVTVEDNGVGLSQRRADEVNNGIHREERPIRSMGLHNVNERIRLSAGEAYGVWIRCGRDAGTLIEIRLPLVS